MKRDLKASLKEEVAIFDNQQNINRAGHIHRRVCKRDIQCRVSILLIELKRLLKLYLSSEFHKFVRGRFSAEPEDKKQKIVSNMYLVSYETFTCLCYFISYFGACRTFHPPREHRSRGALLIFFCSRIVLQKMYEVLLQRRIVAPSTPRTRPPKEHRIKGGLLIGCSLLQWSTGCTSYS